MRERLLEPRTYVLPYVLLWLGVGLLPFQPTDLDVFFWPSAAVAVHGHPLLVYSAGGQALYPNANGPVSLLPLSILAWFLNALGQLDATTVRRGAAMAVFSLFVILMAREAVAAVERLRGAPLTGGPRLLAYLVLSLNTLAWQSVAGYGHIEQPIEIWLLLIAARLLSERKSLGAGVAFGLSIMARSPAVLMTIPLGLAAWRRGLRQAVLFAAAAVVSSLAVLAPFLLADPTDVYHSLFTYRGSLKVGAGSVWSLARGGPLENVAQHYDIALIVLVVVATNLWLARRGGLTEDRLFAAMTVTAGAFAMLAKTVWPYYMFEVFMFGTVWAAGTWRPAMGVVRLVLLPLAVSIFALIAEIGSEQGLPLVLVRTEGPAMFVLLGLTLAWTIWFATRAPGSRTVEAAWT